MFDFHIKCANDCTSCIRDENYCFHSDIVAESCDPRCRPDMIHGGCIYCNGDIKEYYKIEDNIGSTGYTCSFSTDNNKLIYGSSQFVGECPSGYIIFGDYCILQSECNEANKREIVDNECKCKYLYSEERDTKNKIFPFCYYNGVKCGSKHKSYDNSNRLCSTNDCNCGSNFIEIFQRDDLSNICTCISDCGIDKYIYISNDNKKYCLSECPQNAYFYYTEENKNYCIKKCTDKENYYFQSNQRQCLKLGTTGCDYKNEIKCDTSCLHNNNERICISACGSLTYKDANNECVGTCNSNYIKVNESICVSNTNTGNCYFINDGSNNKKCYSNCLESPNPYNIFETKECISDCKSKGKYYLNGEFTCHDSCTIDQYNMKDNNYNTDNDNKICQCKLYGIKDGSIKCYDDEKKCKEAGFKYKKGNQCLVNCISFRHILNDNNKLDECYETVDDCISHQLYYYNKNELICSNAKPNGANYHEFEIDTSTSHPKEDEGRNTYIALSDSKCISSYFPKLALSGRCQINCDSNEYFKTNNPNKCIAKCDNTDFIGDSNECLTECPYFYIEENRKCVVKCKDYGKYFFKGDKKCYDECKKVIDGQTKNYYYNSEDNECLDTCLYNPEKKFSEIISSTPKECLLRDNKYIDENFYIRNGCQNSYGYYYSVSDGKKCVKYCINNIYISFDGRNCISTCTNYYEFNSDETNVICKETCSLILNLRENNIYKKECLQRCPENYYDQTTSCRYIKCQEGKCQDGKECKPYNHYIKELVNSVEIVTCKANCNGRFIKDTNDKECVDICPEYNNIIVSSNNCHKICSQYKTKVPDSEQPSQGGYIIYKCSSTCDGNHYYVKEYNQYKKDCFEKCPERFQFMENNNICIQECPEGKYYDINNKNSNGNYYDCQITTGCSSDQYYCEGKCVNKEDLFNNEIYYIEGNFCVDKCSLSKYEKINDGKVIECKSACDKFKDGSECLQICPSHLNYIGSGNICRNGCKVENGDPTYYFKFAVSGLSYDIIKCASSCPGNFSFYRTNDKECHDRCPSETNEGPSNTCYDNCFISSTHSFTLRIMDGSTPINRCLTGCNDPNYSRYGYIYYYQNVKVCQNKCNNNDYAVENLNYCIRNCSSLSGNYYFYESTENVLQKNFCVTQCPPQKPFLRGKTCFANCDSQSDEKFYIKNFELGETDRQKRCLTDCPQNYPFYTITNDGNYECIRTCPGYYVPNSNSNKKAKLCLSECNSNTSPYVYKIETPVKKCYEECPEEAPFHRDITRYPNDNKCYRYNECPSDAQYNEKSPDMSRFICKRIEECENNYVDYVNKKCLRKDEACPSENKISKYYYDNDTKFKYICIDSCIESTSSSPSFGIYLTNNNECVKECASNDEFVKDLHLIGNTQNKKCMCQNLFHSGEAQNTCFGNSVGQECKNIDNLYKISIDQTKECVSICDNNRILSLYEEICYESTESCPTKHPNTTLIVQTNGIKKCDCREKYYFDENNIKKCLDGDCIIGYEKKYVPEILRCMKNGEKCPSDFNHLFLDKYCLRKCPSGSNNSTINGENICKCEDPKKFWRIISISNYECLYKCFDIHPVYIASTFQCVEKCEEENYIFYDFKCYSSCTDSGINIINGKEISIPDEFAEFGSATCDCENDKFWYYNNNKKFCVEECPDTFKYIVRTTKKCVNECPSDYPYYFNEYCYSSCENEAKKTFNVLVKTRAPTRECLCENGWYYTNNEKTRKECLTPEETCISINKGKNYLIYRTKECVAECPKELFEFNYICYDVCPEKTVDHISEEGNYCSCNLNDGYWYEYSIDDFTYKNCGLEKCPTYDKLNDGKFERMNLIESEKKCVKSCRADGGSKNKNVFAFKNICLEECPTLTKINEENDACLFYDLTKDENIINDKDKFLAAGNIQTNELYEKKETSYNKFGFSFEIYPIDDPTIKDIALNSNKTYIDFSSCAERIYLDKNISEEDKILIAKYDLLPEANINIDKRNDKYLINPVEYELFSSSYTNEKLDALVCEPYEIVISYPLLLSKFDNSDEDTQNDIIKKFEMGKELHRLDNITDTFNFNDNIYKNFCRGLEIDGKDLVYEDRYKYLYPNNKLLCESNCTMNNTDFELKRVNCLCKYKEIFNFYRKEEEANDKFNDPHYFIPTQSPANAELIKCLFKFSLKQDIIKNEAFYICFIVISAEIAILFINVVYGVNGVANNIKKALSNMGEKFRKNKNNQNKNGNIITTSNKPLNNPPRRSNNEEEKGSSNMDNDNISSESNNIEVRNGGDIIKSEYISSEYCSKFFKQNEKGIIKKIERSKIPFAIKHDTKYLIDKKNKENENNYVILTDMNTDNNEINRIIKYIKNTKKEDKYEPKTKKRINLFEDYKNKQNSNNLKEKDLIKVKAIKPVNSPESLDDMTIEDFEKENRMDVGMEDSGCLTLIRREQLFLRVEYDRYMAKKHPSNSFTFFAEFLDKIYLIKIILFIKKYDIFFVQLSLYAFCHLLLWSLLCGFFTIRVIKKIWEEDNFPDLNFYLLYGLISHIIIWMIYKIFLYILDCSDKIKEFLLIKKGLREEDDYIDNFNDNVEEKNHKILIKKYNQLMRQMRLRISIFYVIMFMIIIFCTIYLISFYSIYTGTKRRVLIAYFISLFEIVIIKLIYGICLASLRLASKVNKLKSLYNLVYILDKYIS